MADNPRLRRAISHRALSAVTRVAWSEGTIVISKDTNAPRLIEGNPVLDLGSKGLEYHASIVCEVSNELLLVERSTVALIELIRKIPMEQGNHGRNSGINQVIHKLLVELYAFLVDWIVPPAEGDNARPTRLDKLRLTHDLKLELEAGD